MFMISYFFFIKAYNVYAFSILWNTKVFSSEWDKFAQKTYHANYGDFPDGDITKIDEKDIPDHEILVGG
ncbi:DNA cytosine methyltransferase, partial [Escherichia coli]|uniref:DNA cytosine methyltransferase n=1 Tax=Escherichia coli TaxID=562 RepID=UPI003EE15286